MGTRLGESAPAAAARLLVGAASRAAGAVLESASARPVAARSTALLDLGLGAAAVALDAADRVSGAVRRAAATLPRPPAGPLAGVTARAQATAGALVERGRAERARSEQLADAVVRALVPRVLDAALDQVDLTALVVARVDVDRVVDHADVDRVVARADLDRVLDRLDLDAIVARVDLDRVVDRLDLDAIVARVDLQRVVDRLDVDAVADRVDLDRIVGRLDLVGLAEVVVDGIDLPEIIRESSGSVASEAVRGVRMQSVEADQAVSRVVDRLLLRRGTRRVEAPPAARPVPPGEAATILPRQRDDTGADADRSR